MQQPIIQIRDKLFTGLDQEYNVVDMGIVADVLSQLENYAITKEALEATRLGKHINELRRKARDKLLANRAKCLVKKWRQLLVVPNHSTETPPPGGGNNSHNNNEKPSNGLSVPSHHANNKSRHLSPAIRPSTNGLRPLTSPGIVHHSSLPSSASTSPGLCSSRPSTPTNAAARQNNGRPVSPIVMDFVSKTNAANKRLRKETSPAFPPAKRNRVNGEDQEFLSDRDTRDSFISVTSSDNHAGAKLFSTEPQPPPISSSRTLEESSFGKQKKTRVPKKVVEQKPDTLQRQMQSVRKASGKVLTTVDLVQQLALRSQSPVPNNNNHNELPSSHQETKTELMNRFFDSQDRLSESGANSSSPPELENGSASTTRCSSAAAPMPAPEETPLDEAEAILSQLPPINREEILAQMEREMEQEEEEEEEDDIDGLIPIMKEPPVEITDELVNKLHTDQVESLTGNFSSEGTFHEWHEVVGKATKEGDLLYILPYCIID